MAQATDMSQHFTAGHLVKYSIPSICMMIFMSIYSVVDGLFVSNFAGSTAFAAVNLIMPFIMVLGTVGTMIGSGGAAIVGKIRGEGDAVGANKAFSLFVFTSLIVGIICGIVGFAVMRPVAYALGGRGELLDICVLYGSICMISVPFFILQFAFQTLFITAGKPKLGFAVTVVCGCANIVLDALLVGFLGFGVVGAAIATVTSETIGGVVPIIYFAMKSNTSHLHLVRPHLDWRMLGKACVNGSSEMVANIAVSVVNMLYNIQLLAYIGADGVAAYGVIMYVFMIYAAIFMGYSLAVQPLISFQYGAQNKVEVNSLLHKGVGFMLGAGVLMLIAAEASAYGVSYIFVGYDPGLLDLTVYGFRIYSIAFVLMGVNMFTSGFFTALNNGKISAIVSFLRTLVFEVISVLLLPTIFGIDGIWFSVVVAEIAALAVNFTMLATHAKRYGYNVKFWPKSKSRAVVSASDDSE